MSSDHIKVVGVEALHDFSIVSELLKLSVISRLVNPVLEHCIDVHFVHKLSSFV